MRYMMQPWLSTHAIFITNGRARGQLLQPSSPAQPQQRALFLVHPLTPKKRSDNKVVELRREITPSFNPGYSITQYEQSLEPDRYRYTIRKPDQEKGGKKKREDASLVLVVAIMLLPWTLPLLSLR